MAHSNNPDINQFWGSYSARSTHRTKMIAEEMNYPEALQVKRGNDTLEFVEGAEVMTTGNGQLIYGLTGKVEKAWMENGYARYLVLGVVNHKGDIVGIEKE